MKVEQLNKLWGQLLQHPLLKNVEITENQMVWGKYAYYYVENKCKKQFTLQQYPIYLTISISHDRIADKIVATMNCASEKYCYYQYEKVEKMVANIVELKSFLWEELSVLYAVLNTAKEYSVLHIFSFLNLFKSYNNQGLSLTTQLEKVVTQYVELKARWGLSKENQQEKKSARVLNERKFTKWKHKTLRTPLPYLKINDMDYSYQLFNEGNAWSSTYYNKLENKRTRKKNKASLSNCIRLDKLENVM